MNDEIQSVKDGFEKTFTAYIDQHYQSSNILGQVIHYALSGQGKRVRPLITLLTCKSLGKSYSLAMPAAIAIEFIHTYSLIHDDLPCMDDDDLRRGRPTVHKEFDEGLAVLAGDALLTDAFSILAHLPQHDLSELQRFQMIHELAMASGSKGMVWGQALDLHWTAKKGADQELLETIHTTKTGYLIGAAFAMGAIAAGSQREEIEKLRDCGQKIGLAYQIQDDLIDGLEGTGKSTGKDQSHQKLTILKFISETEAKTLSEKLTNDALSSLDQSILKDQLLSAFVKSLLGRTQ